VANSAGLLASISVVAFVATRDGAKARRFYQEILGLRLISDEPWAIVFEAGGTTIRIQKVESFQPHPFTALGWNVPAIDATVDALAARRVHFERFPGMDQDERGIWASPSGARVAWFKDPDGNVLSLTQL
jgi:catechol 2,3-dioxygenase-like lactoylglutathione lyase family enzyme